MLEWIMNVNLEQVRLRAYELWLRDGMADGRDRDHWRAAECELLGARAEATPIKAPAAAPKRKTRSPKPRSAKAMM
jgi:Protein of unknown function (DUF2934)